MWRAQNQARMMLENATVATDQGNVMFVHLPFPGLAASLNDAF
jgi:hypothetical protein